MLESFLLLSQTIYYSQKHHSERSKPSWTEAIEVQSAVDYTVRPSVLQNRLIIDDPSQFMPLRNTFSCLGWT